MQPDIFPDDPLYALVSVNPATEAQTRECSNDYATLAAICWQRINLGWQARIILADDGGWWEALRDSMAGLTVADIQQAVA